jgi:Lon protease-like protein
MRPAFPPRPLPHRPHLDHLKAQAKELLESHQRRDPAALERLRAALPACENASDEAIAERPLALHDAQSAIAREYGFASWAALRAHVISVQASPDPARFVESLMGGKLPESIREALREAWSESRAEDLAQIPTPETLPLLAARNALLSPGAIAPLMIGRPASIAALRHAMDQAPALVAVFAQRAEQTEAPVRDDLHPVGCLALIRKVVPAEDWAAMVVLEGIRWIRLEEIAADEPYPVVRVAAKAVDAGDAREVDALEEQLRAGAERLAASLGDRKEAALALLAEIDDPSRLSDLVVANLPCSVAEKAAYAEETTVATRLRAAIDLVQRALAAAMAPRSPA